jgi:hypothetical protein
MHQNFVGELNTQQALINLPPAEIDVPMIIKGGRISIDRGESI